MQKLAFFFLVKIAYIVLIHFLHILYYIRGKKLLNESDLGPSLIAIMRNHSSFLICAGLHVDVLPFLEVGPTWPPQVHLCPENNYIPWQQAQHTIPPIRPDKEVKII